MIIYLFTNKKTGKQYVGQTSQGLRKRTLQHRRAKRTYFDRAFTKETEKDFTLEVIDKAKTDKELNEKEIHWINKLNTKFPNGYNLCDGGETTRGYTHKECSKKQMSESKKKLELSGGKNPFYGQKHTEETREKMKKAWTEDRKKEHLKRMKETKFNVNTKKVICLETGKVYESVKEAAEELKLAATNISRACKSETRKCRGLTFRYFEMPIPCQDSNE